MLAEAASARAWGAILGGNSGFCARESGLDVSVFFTYSCNNVFSKRMPCAATELVGLSNPPV